MVKFGFCCDIYGYDVYGRCCDIYGSLRHLWEASGHLWEFVIFMGVVTFMGRTKASLVSHFRPFKNLIISKSSSTMGKRCANADMEIKSSEMYGISY